MTPNDVFSQLGYMLLPNQTLVSVGDSKQRFSNKASRTVARQVIKFMYGYIPFREHCAIMLGRYNIYTPSTLDLVIAMDRRTQHRIQRGLSQAQPALISSRSLRFLAILLSQGVRLTVPDDMKLIPLTEWWECQEEECLPDYLFNANDSGYYHEQVH